MISGAKKFTKDLLTTADGESGDIGRVLWALAILVALFCQVYVTVKNGTFDLQNYGIGIGALLVGGAGALKMKESTETEKTTPPAEAPK